MDIIFLIYYLIKFCITKKYSISNENPLIYKKKKQQNRILSNLTFQSLRKKIRKK